MNYTMVVVGVHPGFVDFADASASRGSPPLPRPVRVTGLAPPRVSCLVAHASAWHSPSFPRARSILDIQESVLGCYGVLLYITDLHYCDKKP